MKDYEDGPVERISNLVNDYQSMFPNLTLSTYSMVRRLVGKNEDPIPLKKEEKDC